MRSLTILTELYHLTGLKNILKFGLIHFDNIFEKFVAAGLGKTIVSKFIRARLGSGNFCKVQLNKIIIIIIALIIII